MIQNNKKIIPAPKPLQKNNRDFATQKIPRAEESVAKGHRLPR